MELVVLVLGLVALLAAGARWARVAQREHYLPGSFVRMALLWVRARPENLLVDLAGSAAVVVALVDPGDGLTLAAGAVAGAAALVFPVGLAWRGRDKPLVWTRRLVVLMALTAGVLVVLAALAALLAPWWALPAIAAVALPWSMELSSRLALPIEERVAAGFQRRAEQRLRQVSPTVVAITGSWGKTTTKNHVRDLAGDLFATAISPASFNNRGGLSRTMNEHLPDGTELLVVEMGMYGMGEIRALCDWVRPTIGVITAIGPMHLERVGSIEGIVRAKSEIVERTETAVLWVDHPALAELATRLPGQRVIRCGTRGTDGLDVAVETVDGEIRVWVGDELVGTVPAGSGVHAGNAACAVGVMLALGVTPARFAERLARLSVPQHRSTASTNEAGVWVIDDTFNSNPEGARAALARLAECATGRRVVVTPGMMELGAMQHAENARFAEAVVASGAELVVVGRTNRRALTAGARVAGGAPTWVPSRRAATEHLAGTLEAGDGVLWENDLPDHYP